MGAIKREMNGAKWTFVIACQCGFACVISLIVCQLGSLFTGSGNVLGTIVALTLAALLVFMLLRPYKESPTLKKKRSSCGCRDCPMSGACHPKK